MVTIQLGDFSNNCDIEAAAKEGESYLRATAEESGCCAEAIFNACIQMSFAESSSTIHVFAGALQPQEQGQPQSERITHICFTLKERCILPEHTARLILACPLLETETGGPHLAVR